MTAPSCLMTIRAGSCQRGLPLGAVALPEIFWSDLKRSPSLSWVGSSGRVRHCVVLFISRVVEQLVVTLCAEAGAAASAIKLATPTASVTNLVEIFIDVSFQVCALRPSPEALPHTRERGQN